jgi:hypothetical protein
VKLKPFILYSKNISCPDKNGDEFELRLSNGVTFDIQ